MTTTKKAPFAEGARVRLVADVDRYPHFLAPKGVEGTFRDYGDAWGVQLDDATWERMRIGDPDPEQWGHCVMWYADGDPGMGPEALRREVEPVAIRGELRRTLGWNGGAMLTCDGCSETFPAPQMRDVTFRRELLGEWLRGRYCGGCHSLLCAAKAGATSAGAAGLEPVVEIWTWLPGEPNRCRGCGSRFRVSEEAIADHRRHDPEDERGTDEEYANLVEFCLPCAVGVESVPGEIVDEPDANVVDDRCPICNEFEADCDCSEPEGFDTMIREAYLRGREDEFGEPIRAILGQKRARWEREADAYVESLGL